MTNEHLMDAVSAIIKIYTEGVRASKSTKEVSKEACIVAAKLFQDGYNGAIDDLTHACYADDDYVQDMTTLIQFREEQAEAFEDKLKSITTFFDEIFGN